MTQREEQFHQLYREYRICGQQAFYANRVQEYQRAHDQAVVVRNSLLFAASAAGVFSQTVDSTPRAIWAVVAAVLGSFAGAVTAYESLIGFPRLRNLYGDAKRNLDVAAIDWDVATDIPKALEQVESIFKNERGQWGQLIVKSAVATLPADAPAPPRDSPQEPDDPAKRLRTRMIDPEVPARIGSRRFGAEPQREPSWLRLFPSSGSSSARPSVISIAKGVLCPVPGLMEALVCPGSSGVGIVDSRVTKP